MRVGIAVWGERVSPVLDAAGRLAVVRVDGSETGEDGEVSLPAGGLGGRAGAIADLEIDVLICGAVSSRLADMLTARGVTIIPWISGTVEEVLDAFIEGTLADRRFAMPGCGCGRQRGRRGRRGSGGGGPRTRRWT